MYDLDDDEAAALIDAWITAHPGKYPDLSRIIHDATDAIRELHILQMRAEKALDPAGGPDACGGRE
jgi:hypothetical protein